MIKDATVVLILLYLAVPLTCAAVPDNTRQAGLVVTAPELNVTGADSANHTIPARYGISPTMIDVKVELSDTSLPGPKGEMAAGPRTIGFSADPGSLAILIVAVIGSIAGIGYLVRRNPEGPEEEDE